MQSHDGQQGLPVSNVRSPYLQVAIIIFGVFMAVLDTSVVNVAVPAMENAFGASTSQIQWVMTGYMLTMGVLVPISGWLTDRFGAKRLFLFALAVFTVGSALCGASWNTASIIFFRIVQAIGGGFMMPVAMTMTFRLFPPERRGLVMGLFGVSIMVAPAFGPTLSGYLVEYVDWRYIFYINVPFGLVAYLLGIVFMQELDHQVHSRFDTWGFVLSTVGFFSILYGLNEIPSHGWTSTYVWTFLTIGVISLVALVIVELNRQDPIIEFRVFTDYMFTMSVIISGLVNIALFAGIFLLPIYLQNIVGLSPMRTGLLMMPAALASGLMMPISGRLFDKIGARPLGLVGLALITVASIGFTSLSRDTSVAYVQWLYILRSIGMGMTMMPVMTAGMNTVPKRWISQSSALSNTFRQVAASLGTALLTTILSDRSRYHFGQLAQQVTPFTPAGQHMVQIQHQLLMTGLSPDVAAGLARVLYRDVLSADAFVKGLNETFWVATAITALAFVCTLFLASRREAELRRGRKHSGSAGARLTLES